MESKIIKLFDYRTVPVPPDMTRWRIPADEINRQLETIALSRARQVPAETVECGDAVCCEFAGDTALPGRDIVLLYPGRNLPGAEEAETAVIGKTVGECFQCSIRETALTLRVREILRNCPAAVSDELIQQEGIEGVSTVEEYVRWFRGKEEPARRSNACVEIALFWLQQMSVHSEAYIVEEEQQAYVRQAARNLFDMMLQWGEDPRIPEEGLEILTEEEALIRLEEKTKPSFLYPAVCEMLSNQHGIFYGEAELEEEYRKMADSAQSSIEEMRKESPPEALLASLYSQAAVRLLAAEAQSVLEV